jgi:D-alanyl-D-alanine dipeptidase
MYSGSGWKDNRPRAHIYNIFQKQSPVDPVTSVSTAPAAQLINAIDDGIQSLATLCGEMNQLMSQARATNVASEPTISLQKNVDALRQKVLSLTQDISMIREAHASIAQMQPLAPVQPGMEGMPPQGTPPQGMPPQGMPPGGEMGVGM